MSRGALIAATAVCAGLGCDATGPSESSFEVRVTATAQPPETILLPDGTLQIECAVYFSASALGSGSNATAAWDGAVLRWFTGTDRAAPLSVDTVPAADVSAWWGSDRLTLVEKLNTTLLLSASIPFIAEIEFFFRVNGSGQRRSASTSAGCGVDPAAATPAPPMVSDVVIEAPTPFEPGDTLVVSYSASAAGRLFGTAVVIEGAWQHTQQVAENLVTESTRELRFTVPPGVMLGEALRVAVYAVDAHGQTNAPAWVQSAPLVDETPPDFLEPSRLVGQYAVGDAIPIGFHARDNHELGDLIVEIGGDSRIYPLDGHDAITQSSLTADDVWLGAPGFAVTVTDAQGLVGPRREAHPDSFRIFPVVDRPRVSWTGLDRYRNSVWDDANERVYLMYREPLVTGGTDRQLELVVLSTATMTTLPGYPLPAPGVALDYTVGGDTVVVSLGDRGTLAIVDVDSRTVSELHLTPGAWRHAGNLTMLGNGRALVELIESGGPPHLALVEIADGTVLWTDVLDRSGVVFVRTRDRSAVGIRTELHLALTCLMVFTSASEHLSGCLSGGSISRGALSADLTGSRFLSAEYLIDVASGSFRLASWAMREDRVPVSVFAPDDTTMYRSDAAGLTHIRVSDGVALERIPFPILGQFFISADGSTMVAAGNHNNTSLPATVVRLQLR